jgi:hypothetical protein
MKKKLISSISILLILALTATMLSTQIFAATYVIGDTYGTASGDTLGLFALEKYSGNFLMKKTMLGGCNGVNILLRCVIYSKQVLLLRLNTEDGVAQWANELVPEYGAEMAAIFDLATPELIAEALWEYFGPTIEIKSGTTTALDMNGGTIESLNQAPVFQVMNGSTFRLTGSGGRIFIEGVLPNATVKPIMVDSGCKLEISGDIFIYCYQQDENGVVEHCYTGAELIHAIGGAGTVEIV